MTGPARRGVLAGWLVMAVVLGVALAVGAGRPAPAQSATARAQALDAQLRCPSCEDVSVADSSAPAAVSIKAIVLEKVDQGESDSAIEGFLVSRYGEGILLRPPAGGGIGAVWIVPIVAVTAALAVLVVFLWRRGRLSPVTASEPDRVLVERALQKMSSGDTGRRDALGAR